MNYFSKLFIIGRVIAVFGLLTIALAVSGDTRLEAMEPKNQPYDNLKPENNIADQINLLSRLNLKDANEVKTWLHLQHDYQGFRSEYGLLQKAFKQLQLKSIEPLEALEQRCQWIDLLLDHVYADKTAPLRRRKSLVKEKTEIFLLETILVKLEIIYDQEFQSDAITQQALKIENKTKDQDQSLDQMIKSLTNELISTNHYLTLIEPDFNKIKEGHASIQQKINAIKENVLQEIALTNNKLQSIEQKLKPIDENIKIFIGMLTHDACSTGKLEELVIKDLLSIACVMGDSNNIHKLIASKKMRTYPKIAQHHWNHVKSLL